MTGQLSQQALDRLLESRRQFLSFIQSRVESAEVAEDILQAAFVKGIEKGGSLRHEETVVAWFYRLLHNAIIDHYRQRGSSERAADALVHELDTHVEPEDSFKGDICGCVSELMESLKLEYRDALRTVDLEERSLAELAGKAGITSNNARPGRLATRPSAAGRSCRMTLARPTGCRPELTKGTPGRLDCTL